MSEPTNAATKLERARCLAWIGWAWGPGIERDLMIKRLAHAQTSIREGDPFEPPSRLRTDAERRGDLGPDRGSSRPPLREALLREGPARALL